jgi:hypothetical protein
MMGWFAIQLNFATSSLVFVMQNFNMVISPYLINIVLGFGLSIAIMRGIKALAMLVNFSMPFFILVLVVSLFMKKGHGFVAGPLCFNGIAMVIGGAIAGVVDLPTYFRYAKSTKDAVLASLALFGFALPFIEAVGVSLGASSNTILSSWVGSGSLSWNMCVALFLILACCSANSANLYSMAANSRMIFGRLKEENKILLLGSVSTCLSCCSFMQNIESILSFMGIVMTSMGSVYLTAYMIECFEKRAKSCFVDDENEIKKVNFYLPFFSWAVGVFVGFLSFYKFITLTSIASLDGFLLSSVVFIISKKFLKERIYEMAND